MGKIFQILSRLSHKVCRLLSFEVILHTKFFSAEMRMPAFQHIFTYTSCYSKGSIQGRNVQQKLTNGSF